MVVPNPQGDKHWRVSSDIHNPFPVVIGLILPAIKLNRTVSSTATILLQASFVKVFLMSRLIAGLCKQQLFSH